MCPTLVNTVTPLMVMMINYEEFCEYKSPNSCSFTDGNATIKIEGQEMDSVYSVPVVLCTHRSVDMVATYQNINCHHKIK